jgi:hypothetical protein
LLKSTWGDVLKNNLWFKAKTYGYGWTPSTWQGWSVTVVYFFLVLIPLSLFSKEIEANMEVFLSFTILLTILFVFICYKKGETPSWNWGKKK